MLLKRLQFQQYPSAIFFLVTTYICVTFLLYNSIILLGYLLNQ